MTRVEVAFDLRSIRTLALGWSQDQLAEFLGTSQSAVSRMETLGRIAKPYKKLLDQLCPFTVTRTEDGTVIVFDPETGISVSRQSAAEAIAELRRLLNVRQAA